MLDLLVLATKMIRIQNKGKLRGDVEEFPNCKHGVEYRYCITDCSRPSEPVASDHDMAKTKTQNVIHFDPSDTEKSTSMASSDCGLKKVSSEAGASKLFTKRPHDSEEFTDRKKFCKHARGNWREKAVVKGKTKYLPINEVMNMPLGARIGKPTRVPPVSSKPSYMVKSNSKFGPSKHSEQLHPTRFELESILTPVKKRRRTKRTSSFKHTETSHAKKQMEMEETASESQMSKLGQICDDPHFTSEIDATLSPAIPHMSTEINKRTNCHFQKKISKEPCADGQSPMSGVKLIEDAKSKNSDAGNAVFTVKEFYMKAAAEEPLHTDPAPVASWIGSFILKDERTRASFQAHPTSQGLSKVIEFSKNMPEVLEFELCMYEDFLRTVFKGCFPDDQDIGLYFFPDDSIRSNTYISHLERLSRNFFLRGCFEGVDLLVFSSKVLDKDHRKRNNCDFLWGMFRRRHVKVRGAAEETMVVDMDNDIPPGFSLSMRGQWKVNIKTEVQ